MKNRTTAEFLILVWDVIHRWNCAPNTRRDEVPLKCYRDLFILPLWSIKNNLAPHRHAHQVQLLLEHMENKNNSNPHVKKLEFMTGAVLFRNSSECESKLMIPLD